MRKQRVVRLNLERVQRELFSNGGVYGCGRGIVEKVVIAGVGKQGGRVMGAG